MSPRSEVHQLVGQLVPEKTISLTSTSQSLDTTSHKKGVGESCKLDQASITEKKYIRNCPNQMRKVLRMRNCHCHEGLESKLILFSFKWEYHLHSVSTLGLLLWKICLVNSSTSYHMCFIRQKSYLPILAPFHKKGQNGPVVNTEDQESTFGIISIHHWYISITKQRISHLLGYVYSVDLK